VWETNFNNELQVSQTGNHVTGLYDGSRGVLDGTINGNILVGTWEWKNHRGVFRFLLANDGNSFTGTFNRSDGFGGAWTGIRRLH
jgi:MscS family membrane protein